MANILKGKPAADALTASLRQRADEYKRTGAGVPCLGILRVGNSPDDEYYATAAAKRAQSVGIDCKTIVLDSHVSQNDVTDVLDAMSFDNIISGILPLLPMPEQIDPEQIRTHIPPQKDADCLTDTGYAALYAQKKDARAPCTPEAVIELLHYYDIPIAGKHAVIIGRSLVVGKPLAMLLLGQNATVTVCHSKTENIKKICRQADILIAAIGRPKYVGADYVKPGAVVIDVGIDVDENGNMCGDVDFDAVEPIASAITPVPGGVGALTTAVLVKNVMDAFDSAADRNR